MLGGLLRDVLGAAARSLRRWFAPLSALRPKPELSIVVCSVDDGRFARCRANWRERLRGRRYELIRIADARSLAEGYNRGIEQSRAERLVFCHDDIEVLEGDFYERLARHLDSADLVGIAGTSRVVGGSWFNAGQPDIHGQVVQPAPDGEGLTLDVYGTASQARGRPIQALDGVFLAVRRSVAEALRFDSATFDGFHLYDIDFTYRAYLAGYRLAVCHDILVYHRSRGRLNEAWRRYAAAFEAKYAQQLSKSPPGPRDYQMLRVADPRAARAAFRALEAQRAAGATIG